MKKTHTIRERSRGVALVTTLLLLTLFTIMTLAMVIATTSDTLIDGYYNNYRASFYATDSGINAARQFMMNRFSSAISTTWTPGSTTPPISSTQDATIVNSLLNTTSGFGAYFSTTGSQGSWPGKFKIDTSSSNTYINTATEYCSVDYIKSPATGGVYTTAPTCTSTGSSGFSITAYHYFYPYQVTAWGQSRANEQNKIVENGTIEVSVNTSTSTSTTQKFSAWGMFIDQYTICDGSYLVPGTITGPVATNGSWNFGTSGTYIFTDNVRSAGTKFGYNFSSCIQSSNQSYSSGSQTIAPQFKGTVSLGQPTIPLPTNSYNQAEAVMDGIGDGSLAVNNTTMNAHLMKLGDTAWPSGSAPSSGVYLPYTVSGSGAGTTRTMNGGGVYVQGNANVTLTASTTTISGNVHPLQVVTIVQGTGGSQTTTTITYDLYTGTGGQTTSITQKVGSGSTSTPVVINGLPQNSADGTPSEAAMVYVNGNITSLSGPSSGAAIQDTSAVSVVAASDITITGNITYKTEPVTTSGSSPDQLITGNDNGQVLGIFTAGGDVHMGLASTGNLEIDASIATISQGGSGALDNTGSSINTLTIVGGRIQNTIQNINSTTRNVYFDRRFAQGNFGPPWFPSTTFTSTGTTSYTTPTVTANRVSWVNTTAQ